MVGWLLFTKKQREFLKKIQDTNSDDIFSWKLPNVIFPLSGIVLSIICYVAFKDSKKITALGAFNLVLNGSLAMFALNRLGSIGVNLFKFDQRKEKKAGISVYNLRIRINYYFIVAALLIMALYIYQVINSPFAFSLLVLAEFLFSIFLICCAITFSKYAFLLQESLLERTLGDDIRDDAKETKIHLDQKYGE